MARKQGIGPKVEHQSPDRIDLARPGSRLSDTRRSDVRPRFRIPTETRASWDKNKRDLRTGLLRRIERGRHERGTTTTDLVTQIEASRECSKMSRAIRL